MQISEHSVRERAYFIWESEGCIHGRATVHWLRAETELRGGAVAPVTAKVAKPSKTRKAAAEAKPAVEPAAAKRAAAKTAMAKPAVAKPAIAKPAVVTTGATKPAAPKVAKAAKTAVTAGLAARAKPTRAPAALH